MMTKTEVPWGGEGEGEEEGEGEGKKEGPSLVAKKDEISGQKPQMYKHQRETSQQ